VQRTPSAVRFPDGETLVEVQHRSVAELDRVSAAHPKQIVAAVTHADVIRLALAHYAGIHLDLYQRLVVGPASVTAVVVGDGAPRIVRVNDVGSLADLVPSRRVRG
jgi:probable phosphoglycerate mutase